MKSDPIARLQSVLVEEIMIPLAAYPKVDPECSLRDAIEKLLTVRIEIDGVHSSPRILLVIDKSGKLIGTARRRDIMRGLEPHSLLSEPLSYRKKLFDVRIDPNLLEISHDHIVKGIRAQSRRPIKDVMLPVKATISHDDHLIKAVYEMVGYGLSLLPVTNGDRVVGVLRSIELFRELGMDVLQLS